MSTNLNDYLKFVVLSRDFRKKRDSLNLFRIPSLQSRQTNSAYSEWLKYLKTRGLYVKYRIHIANALKNRRERFSAKRVGEEAIILLEVVTEAHLIASIGWLDQHYSGYCWKAVYDEYLVDKDYATRRRLLSRKLYHMDSPKIQHSKFLGSCKPRKHVLENLIDKIFFIKRN